MNCLFQFIATLLILSVSLVQVQGFTVTTPTNSRLISSRTSTSFRQNANAQQTPLRMSPNDIFTSVELTSSTSNTISAATVDPTTALTQVLGSVLNTPLILAVPIVAAISVASLIAWLIVSYANPADPDE
mmetsp:Transcript_6821/g.8502  ORF Transcript_6821/g.8502 Transcript_6821/m.8502 type:complete len:130 (-) Transcript_6821:43-432(-)